MRYDYDLIILGGGSAGIVAGVMAGNLGLRVLLMQGDMIGNGHRQREIGFRSATVASSLPISSLNPRLFV